MSDTLARLQRMADQIARNFEAMGHDDAIAATADHIAMFWDPRMKAQIFASDRSQLSAVARSALDLLETQGAPPPQTRATRFNAAHESHRSDGG